MHALYKIEYFQQDWIEGHNNFFCFATNEKLTEWEIEQRELGFILLNAYLEEMITDIYVDEPREGLVHVWVIGAAGDGGTRRLHYTVGLLLQVVRQARHITRWL